MGVILEVIEDTGATILQIPDESAEQVVITDSVNQVVVKSNSTAVVLETLAGIQGQQGIQGIQGIPGVVQEIIPGPGTDVNNSDPIYPVISADVLSVAGRTGDVVLDKTDVGLNLVDNVADADKPVSTATQAELDLKADLASPTFTGTVSGIDKTMVGLDQVDNTSDIDKPVSTATQTAIQDGLDAQTHDASDIVSGIIAPARLGTGTPDTSTFLRGDGAWEPAATNLDSLFDVIVTAPSAAQALRYNGTDWVNANLIKSDVGLANVDNTSDANKPVSTAQQTALDLKANISALAAVAFSGSASDITTGTLPTSVLPPLSVNDVYTVASQAAMLALTAQRGDMAIRTDNGLTYVLSTDDPTVAGNWKEIMAAGQVTSVNGRTGTITLSKSDVGLSNADNTSDANKPISTATQGALDLKAPLASPTFTGTVSGITKAMVGLANVDNTTDLNKPISTATQTALNAKANASHTHGVIDLTATGTRDATTFLRGDNTWATVLSALPARIGDIAATVTDWNNAIDNGWYMGNGAANGPTPTGWYIGEVLKQNSLYQVQTVTQFTGASAQTGTNTLTYRRICLNGTWGAWYKLSLSVTEGDARWLPPVQNAEPTGTPEGHIWYDADEPAAAVGAALPATWASYTPAWTASSANPSIGNGSLIGRYQQVGKTVHFAAYMVAGSTTTYGTGTWYISLPVTSSGSISWVFVGDAFDASAGGSVGLRAIFSTQNRMALLVPGVTAGGYDRVLSGNTVPFTWASGDYFSIVGTYEAA